MKLLQRIVLRCYGLKLNLLQRIFPLKAADAAFSLFCTPYTKHNLKNIPQVFIEAENLKFRFNEYSIQGFCWKPTIPNGQQILIVHGFDSFSHRFEKFIEPLKNEGFTVYAFDAPAHGLSSGKTINALLYSQLILRIIEKYGKMHGIMAHSFGSLAAALAIEKLASNHPNVLAIIAPATETTRSLTDFCSYLGLSEQLKVGIENKILSVEGRPISWYSVARIIEALNIPVLWLHDKLDKITPYSDMSHLVESELPHIKFHITEGLGHSLYRDPVVAQTIISFFTTTLQVEKLR